MKRLLMGCGAAAWLAWGVSGAAITAQPGADGTISIPVAEPGIYKLELKARAGEGVPGRNIILRSAFGDRVLIAPNSREWGTVEDYAAIGDFCDRVEIRTRRPGIELGGATLTRVKELHLPRQHYVARPEPNRDRTPDINPPTFRWPALAGASEYTVLYKPVAADWKSALRGTAVKNGEFQPLFFRPRKALTPGEWEWKLLCNGRERGGPYRFTVSAEAVKWELPPWSEFYNAFSKTRPRLMYSTEELARIGTNVSGPMKGYADRLIAELEAGVGRPFSAVKKGDEQVKGINDLMTVLHFGRPIHEYLVLGRVLDRPDFRAEGKRRALTLLERCRGKKVAFDQDFANGLITQSLAFAYDYLGDELNAQERAAIRADIVERLKSTRYPASLPRFLYDAHAWQSTLHQAVCGAMAIWEEEPYAREFLQQMLPFYVALYPWFGGGDGGSAEGTHYGVETNALTSLIPRALWRNFCGLDLAGNPWLRNNVWFAIYTRPGDVKSSWFGDNGADPAGELGVAAPLLAGLHGALYPNPAATAYADRHLNLERTDLQRLSRGLMLRLLPLAWGPFEAPQPAGALPPARAFRDVGIAIAHTDIADAGRNITLEFRSSPYGAYAHAHADQNSFNLMARGEKLVLDSGYYIGWHDRHHFGYTIRTAAHNTILVDGRGQPADCSYGWGRISGFRQGEDYVWMRGDAAAAYLDPALDRFDRGILLLRQGERAAAVIFDDLKAADGKRHRYSWLLHLGGKPEIDAGGRSLTVKRERAALRADWLEPEALEFSVTDFFNPKPVVWEYRKSHFKTLEPQWHVRAECDGGTELRFVTVLQAGPKEVALEFGCPVVRDGWITTGDWKIRRDGGRIRLERPGREPVEFAETEQQENPQPLPPLPERMEKPRARQLIPAFRDGETVCFAGDSITQDGTYIELLNNYYQSRYPERRVRLVNCGVGGDTLFDLIPRLESDVLAHKPDWIFVMIGTNDMNRRLYGDGKNGADYERRRAVCRERFGRKLNELLERLKKSGGGRVVLMSPPCYDEYTSGDPARENNVGADRALADFTAIAAETAARHGVPFIDQHTPMLEATRRGLGRDAAFTLFHPDRLHPARAGHYLLASKILEAQGESGPLAEWNAKGTAFTLTPLSLPMWLDPVFGNAPELEQTWRDRNRATLRVSGLADGRYRLCINGREVMAGSAGEFAVGVDLAALPGNPWLLPSKRAAVLNRKAAVVADRKLRRPLVGRQLLLRARREGASLPPDEFEAVRRLLAEQPENSTQAGHYRRFLEGASAEALAQGEAEVHALQEESRRIHQPVKLQCELERLP